MSFSSMLSQNRRRQQIVSSSALAILAVAAGASAAQAEDQATVTNGQIQEVVVTAQRRSQDAQTVPVSVQAISANQLRQAGVQQSTDIAKIAPNVTISLPVGEGNQPNITIRGIGLNDYNTNNSGPNGIYVDDVFISAPSAQAFGLFDVEQIQVLKGPQGTLYGRNTSGGAVLFTSKRPSDAFHFDGTAEYSSFNSYQVQAAVGGPIVDGLSGRVAVSFNHSDGFMTNDLTNSSASGADSQAVRLQLLYHPNEKWSVLLSSTIANVQNKPEEYRHIGTFVPGTQSDPAPEVCSVSQIYAGSCVDMYGFGTPKGYWEGSYNRQEDLKVFNALNFLRADYKSGPYTLTSITSVQYNDKHMPEDSDASPNRLLEVTYGVRSNTWTQELRAAYASKNFNWVVGGYYLYEILKQNQPAEAFLDGDRFGGFGIPAGVGAFDGIAQIDQTFARQMTRSAAIFGQADYTWDRLTLTLGGRYTNERKTFDHVGWVQYQQGGEGNFGPIENYSTDHESLTASNFTWRAALSYKLADRTMVYGSAATGFKSGGVNGGFTGGADPAVVAVELTPVKPETVRAYEVGLKSTLFDRRLVVDVAAFYNDYDNQQVIVTVNRPITINTTSGPSQILSLATILSNARRGHSEGVEMQITAVPVRGLTVTLNPAWLRTRVTDGSFISYDENTPGVFTPTTVSLAGKEYANAPHFSFSGSVNYVLDLGNDNSLEFHEGSTYLGAQWFDTFNDPLIRAPGYWVHDLGVTYRSHQNWELGGFIRNFSNTKYPVTLFDLSQPYGFLSETVGRPRTYGVQLGYHF